MRAGPVLYGPGGHWLDARLRYVLHFRDVQAGCYEHQPRQIPDGVQVLALGDANGIGSAIQTLAAALQPDTTYALTYFVGQRLDPGNCCTGFGFAPYFVELVAGNSILALESSTAPAPGTFLPATILYTSPSSGPLIGQALGIRISTAPNGGQTLFDDFQLQTVPEPATFGPMAVALAALGGLGYRRRKSQAALPYE